MRTIFKYPLQLQDSQRIMVPTGAIPRHLDVDPRGVLCLWMEVEDTNSGVGLPVYIRGTGHQIPEDLPAEFFSSVVSGPFVWHVFLGEEQ